MDENGEKIEELTAIIQAVKDRVRARYPDPSNGANPIALPDLLPIVHARDAAQAKMASIGSVNPRRGGPINAFIQTVKKTISRGLGWFVRDQITFNREIIGCIEAILESMNDANRTFLAMAGQIRDFGARVEEMKQVGADARKQQAQWDRRLADNESLFLRGIAEIQGRATSIEKNTREIAAAQHNDFRGELERGTTEIQKKLWADMEKIRLEYERMIHNELRVLRQRIPLAVASRAVAAAPFVPQAFDYQRFVDRFRGSEEYVRSKLHFYVPYFEGRREVLDIGCGRGEFLELVEGCGIDLSEESIAYCRRKGLRAEVADLFPYLENLPDSALDGIFSSQVVEHLPPDRLPEMIQLCAAKLARGGLLALETPNPDCLAIFATHFYLDPTHTRPLPSALLAFYMEEAGMGGIEVHPLSPAVESFPEIAELPEGFRKRFFGGLDYAIFAKKL
ncbi:MAG: class I SAM-dependent methyltransferase [Bryobacteraceae bacterium]